MSNVYLEKIAEISEDLGHFRKSRKTKTEASASVAAGAAIGLGAGHALNKVHDKAVTNAEDIIRSKGADAIGNAGRAQKEHVAQALFRDAEILNAGADSIASKAGALSKLRGRLAIGGAALGGAAYAAHRLTEKKAEDNNSGVLDASLYTAAGAAGAAIPTSLHAGMVRKTIEQKRDNRLVKFKTDADIKEGLARADHSVAKARTLGANFEVDEHGKYGRDIFSTKDSYLAEANRLHAAQDAAKAGEMEAAKKLSSTLRDISNRRDTIISRYGKLTNKLTNRVKISAGVGAGVGLAAYGVNKLTEKKAEEEAKKSQPVNTTHLALSLGAGAGVGTIAANTAAGIYSDKAYDSIEQRISLSKDKLRNKNAMNVAKHDAARNEWFESKRLKNFADLDRWLGEDTNVKNPHDEKFRSAIHRHDRHMYKYQSIERNMVDDVLKKERRILKSGLPAGIAVGATAYLLNAKKKSPEGWEHAKTAAWGIHAKDSYGDVLARTPGGIDDDYKRILSQSRELASRKPAVQVNSELESVYARIKAKGLENAHPDELVELSKLKAMPRVDSVKVLQDNNLKALEHVAMRGATPHSQWYSGTHPNKFKYLVGVNLENLKKVKRAARSVKL